MESNHHLGRGEFLGRSIRFKGVLGASGAVAALLVDVVEERVDLKLDCRVLGSLRNLPSEGSTRMH